MANRLPHIKVPESYEPTYQTGPYNPTSDKTARLYENLSKEDIEIIEKFFGSINDIKKMNYSIFITENNNIIVRNSESEWCQLAGREWLIHKDIMKVELISMS